MTQSRTVRRLAAGLAVLALVTSGCTDTARPKPLPSSSAAPSVSPSASASPSAPVLPEAAKGTSAASADSFARHYVDVINYSMHTGDTAALRSSASTRCQTCRAIVDAIEKAYRAGRLEGEGWKVISSAPAISTDKQTARVSMRVHISRQLAYEAPSSSPSVSRPQKGNLDFGLVPRDGAWVVDELVAVE